MISHGMVLAQHDATVRATSFAHMLQLPWGVMGDRVAATHCRACGCEALIDLDAEGDGISGNATKKECFTKGVDRVVFNDAMESTTLKRAVEEYAVRVAVVFVRNDGWRLGCSEAHADAARGLWGAEWVEERWVDGRVVVNQDGNRSVHSHVQHIPHGHALVDGKMVLRALCGAADENHPGFSVGFMCPECVRINAIHWDEWEAK